MNETQLKERERKKTRIFSFFFLGICTEFVSRNSNMSLKKKQWCNKKKTKFCEQIARSGNLELLKFLREHGCPWDSKTCSSAACNGHLECLKYAHENGCPWDEKTCSKAAEKGHLECLKYAHESGCPGSAKYA